MSTVIASCHLKSLSPYSQSRPHDTPKKEKELDDDYERRTWPDHLHVNKATGQVFIPPGAFSQSILEAAKFLSLPVPGKGKATFTKNFEASVRVQEPLVLPLKAADVQPDRLFLHANGQPGGGRRVWRYYPRIDAWEGVVRYYVLDPIITQDVFEKVLLASGSLIGIGRFRPRNRGYYGRFEILEVSWSAMN